MSEVGIALPRYRCHKEVWALKIELLKPDPKGSGDLTLHPENREYAAFVLPAAWVAKHQPKEGGYWVQYKGGYTSYSPADAFEEGYSPIEAHTQSEGAR